MLEAQRRLSETLDSRIAPEPYGDDVSSFWQDMRALSAMLLASSSPDLVAGFSGGLPNLVSDALQAQADRVADVADRRRAMQASSRNSASGPRILTWLAPPTDVSLMAGIAIASLEVLIRQDPADLDLISEVNGYSVPKFVNRVHPSPFLVELTRRHSVRKRLTSQIGMHPIRNKRQLTASKIKPTNIPPLIWLAAWESDFAPLVAETELRELTGRQFVSMALIKRSTSISWDEAGRLIGMREGVGLRFAHKTVNTIAHSGNIEAFGDRLLNLFDLLNSGRVPLVDYQRRFALFGSLSELPSETLVNTAISSEARARNAAAWVWALLTGRSLLDAPAREIGTVNHWPESRNYFRKAVLPNVRPALISIAGDLAAERGDRLASYEVA